ncbi:MAG: PaaI family thioesterase [Saccharofermentanales bacterium]
MDDEKTQLVRKDKFAKFIGIELVEVGDGYAKAHMMITPDHLNGLGIVQGGSIFTLADFAFAAAANSEGFITVGINASISYFKPPLGKDISAVASKISASRKICNYKIDVFDEDGTIIANMTAIGYIKDSR